MRRTFQVRRLARSRWLVAALLLCTLRGRSQGDAAGAAGQAANQAADGASSAAMGPAGGRVVLVLPFDNRSGKSNLAWVGDSFPDTLNQRLTSARFLTITRDDRQFALDHLGLPLDFRPSRATTIRIAQTLDADFVIVGSYTVDDTRIAVQAQVLDVNRLRLSEALSESSDLTRLFDVENTMAWKVARQIDPQFHVAEQTFLTTSGRIPLSSFENYIRGVEAISPMERVKRLQMAVQASPNYPAALLALGKAEYEQGEYEAAAVNLAKIPPTDRRALEASFYTGLARFNMGKYAEAEAAFAFVTNRLPLPEVVNNQGVASSRQGHDAAPLFQRASNADPKDADYHYNLAVALFRRGDRGGAEREADRTLALRPRDKEAAELKASLGAGKTVATPENRPANADGSGFDPLERIRRTYSEASFRQAAFQLDQMRAARMATLPAAEQARQYTQLGQDYLAEGLVPEAEQEFQAAIAADGSSAAAHLGLAQVRERSGTLAEARAEAQSSITRHPNAAAYVVLARLDLQANQLADSAANVGKALQLEPGDSAALGMKQALKVRGQSVP